MLSVDHNTTLSLDGKIRLRRIVNHHAYSTRSGDNYSGGSSTTFALKRQSQRPSRPVTPGLMRYQLGKKKDPGQDLSRLELATLKGILNHQNADYRLKC